MPGASCDSWAGAAGGRAHAPWSGMRTRFGGGSGSAGQRLKKSPKRAAHHRLARRKWIERAPAPLPHLGAARADAGVAMSLQLEDAVGGGGGDVVEFLLPAVSRRHPQPADHPVSRASAAPHSRQAADRLGRAAGASQPRGVGVREPAARALVAGVPARLCAGAEPGGVSVVTLEATRVAQLLPAGFRATEYPCPARFAPHAPPADPGLRFPGAGGPLSVVTILCEAQ